MSPPDTAEKWLTVAQERMADAEAIYNNRPTSIGSIYMADYAIECSLKTLLQKRSIPYPRSGREGHNLDGLWKASGLQVAALRDSNGTQTFFLDRWSTNWRYETSLPHNPGLEVKDLLQGAKKLIGWIQNRIDRRKPRRRR